jgi:hypothetical protein
MKGVTAVVATIAAAVLLVSVRVVPPLVDRKLAFPDVEFQQIFHSPIVVVGTVLSDAGFSELRP